MNFVKKEKSVSLLNKNKDFYKSNISLVNFFSVVRFPNSVCSGDTINGTCYSSEECSARGGTNSGSCAGGYGVCCTCEYQFCFSILYLI